MRLLVSGSTVSVGRLAQSWPDHLGHLLTPANGNSVASVVATGLRWAVDNGAYSGFSPERFRALLQRCRSQPRLLWIVCPDVVANARETLRLFDQWSEEVADAGPVAFVGQDGQEDLPVSWDQFSCLFIGGSTRWKLSQAAGDLIAEAKRRGRLVHMGRVNSRRRMEAAYQACCDSVDGSSASMFGDRYIHQYLRWIRAMERQELLL